MRACVLDCLLYECTSSWVCVCGFLLFLLTTICSLQLISLLYLPTALLLLLLLLRLLLLPLASQQEVRALVSAREKLQQQQRLKEKEDIDVRV